MTPKLSSISFKFSWPLTMMLLLLLPTFMALGVWQLHRAEEKRLLQAEFDARQQIEPLTLTEAMDLADPNYYPIHVKGRFDNDHTFLLDNQFYNHKVGYYVITPLIIPSDPKIILINRGWIPMKGDRSLMMDKIPIVTNTVRIKGLLYIPHKNPLITEEIEASGWPERILAINIPLLSEQLNRPVYPWIVLLDPRNTDGFARHWQPVNMTASRHSGYAFQWFSMGAVLVIIYLGMTINFAGRRRN